MDRPLELAFHNMKPSEELERLIHERMAWLEQLGPDIVGCRVTVELQNHTHHSGNIPEVHIEIQMRGKHLVVNHQHNRGGGARSAVHDAFKAAAVQIKEYKARKTDHLENPEFLEDTATD